MVIVLLTTLVGCLYTPGPSPSYPASIQEVDREFKRLASEPKGLERPLVVMDGWVKTGGGDTIKREIKKTYHVKPKAKN